MFNCGNIAFALCVAKKKKISKLCTTHATIDIIPFDTLRFFFIIIPTFILCCGQSFWFTYEIK